MKISLLCAVVVLAIGFPARVLAQWQNTVDPQVRQQIEAVRMQFVERYNKHDAAAMAALWTEDAVEVRSWAGVASGREAIGKRFAFDFASGPGKTVLDSGIPLQAGLHVYAHPLRGVPGGVALLIINTDRSAARTLSIPAQAQLYTLSALHLKESPVQLNGKELQLTKNDDLPELKSIEVAAGNVTFAPATITFLALLHTGNSACR